MVVEPTSISAISILNKEWEPRTLEATSEYIRKTRVVAYCLQNLIWEALEGTKGRNIKADK